MGRCQLDDSKHYLLHSSETIIILIVVHDCFSNLDSKNVFLSLKGSITKVDFWCGDPVLESKLQHVKQKINSSPVQHLTGITTLLFTYCAYILQLEEKHGVRAIFSLSLRGSHSQYFLWTLINLLAHRVAQIVYFIIILSFLGSA